MRVDIDHKAYMPAAWRLDDYLDATEDEDLDLSKLRSHKLAFAAAPKAANARKDDVEDLVVHDPLLEAGKAKFKQGQRARQEAAERVGRPCAGLTRRTWPY